MAVPLNSLFNVVYGNKFDLNKMIVLPRGAGAVNFVGRSSQRHGVTGSVKLVDGNPPFPKGSITVALGGSRLLASFVQLEPFYTAQNVAVLQPIAPMSMSEKLYICLCIEHNRFRYSAFGREANRTLRTLPVPARDEFPPWVSTFDIGVLKTDFSAPVKARSDVDLAPALRRTYKLSSL